MPNITMIQSETASNNLNEELKRLIARVQQTTTVAQMEHLITEYVDSDRVLFINKAFEVLLNRSENARLLYGRVRSILEQDHVIIAIADAFLYDYSFRPLRTSEARAQSLQVAAETLKHLEKKYPGSTEALTARMIYDDFAWGNGKYKSVEEIGKGVSPYKCICVRFSTCATLRARGNHRGLPLQKGVSVGADPRVCPNSHVEIISPRHLLPTTPACGANKSPPDIL